MLTPLDAALLPMTLAALCVVPVVTLALHAFAAFSRLFAPLAVELCDLWAALVSFARPDRVPIAPTLVLPLSGVASVDRPVLMAFL